MDFKARLKALEERRGETIDETMEKVYAKVAADPETPAHVAKLLSSNNPDDRLMALIGGLEHHFGKFRQEQCQFTMPTMSLEDGNVSTLKEILDKILAWIVKKYHQLYEYMGLTKVVLDDTQDKLTDMISMSRLHRRSHTSSEFKITTRLNYYVCRNRYITAPATVNQTLGRTAQVIQTYFDFAKNTYPEGVRKLAEAVRDNKSLPEIAGIARDYSVLRLFGERGYTTEGSTLYSFDMFGNVTSVMTYNPSGDDFDIIRSIDFGLKETSDGKLLQPEALTFPRVGMQSVDEMLRYISTISESVEKGIGGFFSNERNNMMQPLRDSIAVIRRRLDNEATMTYDEADYRQMVSVLETYMAWISSPFLEMATHGIRVMKAMLNLVEANLT